MRLCDLRQIEVINICNCKKLGCVVDIEFDHCTGCIKAIVVSGTGKLWCFFGTESECVIPFNCIRQIGTDIILVEVQNQK